MTDTTCRGERHFRIDADGVFIVPCEQPDRHFGSHWSREHRIMWSGDDSSKPLPWVIGEVAAACPCRARTHEDERGRVLWRAADTGEWCGNPAKADNGWCDDRITKLCQWCRHD